MSASARWLPRKPAPPVMRAFTAAPPAPRGGASGPGPAPPPPPAPLHSPRPGRAPPRSSPRARRDKACGQAAPARAHGAAPRGVREQRLHRGGEDALVHLGAEAEVLDRSVAGEIAHASILACILAECDARGARE